MNLLFRLKLVFIYTLTAALLLNSLSALNVKNDSGNKKTTDQLYEKFSGSKIYLDDEVSYSKGEWGILKLKPFIIQPTVRFIERETNTDELYKMFDTSRSWRFDNITLDGIYRIFLYSGIGEKESQVLIKNTRKLKSGNSFVTTPPDSILLTFTSEIRTKLYPVLGRYNTNIMYSQPLYFNASESKDWFYCSKLGKGVIKKLSSLVYIVNGICYISDIHLITKYFQKGTDRISLIQVLYRVKTLDAYLTIKKGQDIGNVAKYWGNLGRVSDVKSKLQKLSSKLGGKINIKELLPKIPMKRLNTYCGSKEFDVDYKDCHWTTINFFNSKVDERYYDLFDFYPFMEQLSEPLHDKAELKFGDIISVFSEDGELMHSCTHIAGNLVLTKNGMGNLKPFILAYEGSTAPIYGTRIAYLSRRVSDSNEIEIA